MQSPIGLAVVGHWPCDRRRPRPWLHRPRSVIGLAPVFLAMQLPIGLVVIGHWPRHRPWPKSATGLAVRLVLGRPQSPVGLILGRSWSAAGLDLGSAPATIHHLSRPWPRQRSAVGLVLRCANGNDMPLASLAMQSPVGLIVVGHRPRHRPRPQSATGLAIGIVLETSLNLPLASSSRPRSVVGIILGCINDHPSALS
jgi:hypothetical protein